MNNKIIIAVVAVVVVGAGAWYFTTRSGGVVIPGQVINNPQTMAALIAAGRPVKCTVTPSADNNNMSGTFYLSGKKVRGDYSVSNDNQVMMGHMVLDGDTTYSWFDGQPMGFKMMNSTEVNTNNPAAEDQSFDPNKMMGYQCEGWSVDASKFSLPADVKFSDFSTGFVAPAPPVNSSAGAGASASGSVGANVNAGGGATGSAAQCAACDQVPASYRDQCRSSLGCN